MPVLGETAARKTFYARYARRWLALLGAALAVAWLTGFTIFAQSLSRQSGHAVEPSGAIVVLTGGSARVRTGLDLLSAGKGEELFVSGVHESTDIAEILSRWENKGDALACCITLDHKARNTVGNAHETAAWLARNEITSIRLVTSAYHMPRALLEFRMAAPGVAITTHPVEVSHVRLETWWQWPGTARLLMTEYNKFLVTLARYALNSLGLTDTAVVVGHGATD